MRNTCFLLTLALFLAASAAAGEPEFGLDSNTAFYEGEEFHYVLTPPNGYRLVIHKAKSDGYSFAFVPQDDLYDSAAVMVGVHLYKIRGMSFEEALLADTGSIREYYGEDLLIRPVSSVTNATDQELVTFYLDKKDEFIPNVMLSYFDGGPELVILELVIKEGAVRVRAEEIFMGAVGRFKALHRGTLGSR